MKLKEGFVLRKVAGETVVIPAGDQLDLNMMITLNGTGKVLWERLGTGATRQELIDALLAEYDVDAETAAAGVDGFVKKLEAYGFLV